MWEWTCKDKDGNVKFKGREKNLVVDQGLQWALDRSLLGSPIDSIWFIGLTDAAPTLAAGDTLVTHAGWVEIPFVGGTDAYTGNRQSWVGVRAAGAEVISNSASTADFSIITTTTIGGAFLCSTSNTNAMGTLFSVVEFTGGNQAVNNLDTLEVTYSITAADA